MSAGSLPQTLSLETFLDCAALFDDLMGADSCVSRNVDFDNQPGHPLYISVCNCTVPPHTSDGILHPPE